MSNITYKMQPAGHEAPAPRRKYPEPDRKLKDAFERYLGLAVDMKYPADRSCHAYCNSCRDDLYKYANSLLEGIHVTPEEAHGLLIVRELKDNEKDCAGFFLSAIYNKSDVKEIVYDLDIELSNLAYKLSQDRAFINRGNGYDYSGTQAQGIIINYVEGKNLNSITACYAGEGSVVTYGAIAYNAYNDDDDELIETVSLNVTVSEKVRIHGLQSNPGIDEGISFSIWPHARASYHVWKHEMCKFPELQEYVDKLKARFEQGRNNYRIVLETVRSLGSEPHEKIRQDLVDILKRADKDI